MSDSFHHHVPDTGTAGHPLPSDLGLAHHTGHSGGHHDPAAATKGSGPDPGGPPDYGTPDDVDSPDRRADGCDQRASRGVRSRALPRAIGVVFLVVFLVLFVAAAIFIALGAGVAMSGHDSSPSISVPDSGSR